MLSIIRNRRMNRVLALGAVTSMMALAASANAAVLTWDTIAGNPIDAGSGTWDLVATNWNNAGVGVAWTQTNATTPLHSSVFAGTDGVYAITVGTNVATQGLTFNNSGYTLSAAAATTVTNSTGITTVAVGKTATIGTNVSVERNQAFFINGGGTLNIIGTGARVRNASANASVLTGGTTVDVGVGGTLSNGSSLVVGNFNANTGDGTLLVNGGTVTVTSNNLVIGNNQATVSATGLLTLNSGSVTVAGTTRFGSGGSGNSTGTFNLNGGTLTTNAVQGTTAAAGFTSTGTFNFNGGLLRTNGANASFFQSMTRANVRDGGANIQADADATIAQNLLHSNIGGDLAIDGGLTKSGTAVLTLNGNNDFTGLTTVSAGGLRIQTATGLGTTDSGTTVSNNARLMLSGVTITGESLTIAGQGGNFFGALQAVGGVASVWDNGVLLAANDTRIGTASASSSLTVTGVIDDGANSFSVGFRNESATGTVILQGANTYGGNTNLVGGTVRLEVGNDRLPTGTTLNFGSNNVSGRLDLNGFNQQVAGLAVLQTTGTYSNEITSAGAATLTVANNANNSFSGSITGAGLALTKSGTGTLTLTGTNSFGGETTVSNGILDIDSALANNGADFINIAKDANDDFAVGAAPELQRAVGALSSLVGYGATEVGGLNTVASLIGGSTNAATSVDMAFRGRNDAIVAGETSLLSSDILRLEGLDGVVFVLQMSYDPAAALANGQTEITLKLGYLNTDTNQWMNAIDGNHGTNTGSFFLSSYVDAGSPLDLGSYGVDVVNNVVWAVLDHNSFFAVIPTPGALPAGLLLMGLVAATTRRRQA
jgi:autotransporter-associated beta strand protein